MRAKLKSVCPEPVAFSSIENSLKVGAVVEICDYDFINEDERGTLCVYNGRDADRKLQAIGSTSFYCGTPDLLVRPLDQPCVIEISYDEEEL